MASFLNINNLIDNSSPNKKEQCGNFIKVMTSIHKSFDKIIQLRDTQNTFFGNTLPSFQNELHLKNILNSIKPSDNTDILKISDVRDFLIKNYNDPENAYGIMGWVCFQSESLKGIEIVNPTHDLFDKWITKHPKGNKPTSELYKSFLLNEELKSKITTFKNFDNETQIRTKLFPKITLSKSIFSNIKKMMKTRRTIGDWSTKANGWMTLPDNTPFNFQEHHIVFQEIANVNMDVWENSGGQETQYKLFMRGSEIITHSGIQLADRQPIQSYVPLNHIYFPISSDGLVNLDLVKQVWTNNIGTTYFEYNDRIGSLDPMAKINSFKTMFNDNNNNIQIHRKLYQMLIRGEYKHQGNPSNQQHPNATTTTTNTSTMTFKTTPYCNDGLVCSLCTRVIGTAKTGTKADDWFRIYNKRQSYDVDHLLNLIFNDLFNLNEINNGIGFTNTCPDCNQAFKSEKIWSPSLALWEELITIAGLTTEYREGKYLWPGREIEGLKMRGKKAKPVFEGSRVFTIENIRKSLDQQLNNNDFNIEIVNQNKAIKSQGITWKNHKDDNPQIYNNLTIGKNFTDIEEIFLNRIMVLINVRKDVNDSLVQKILAKEKINPEDGFNPIIDKYIKSIEDFNVGETALYTLKQWASAVRNPSQENQIIQHLKEDERAKVTGLDLHRSSTFDNITKKDKYLILIDDLTTQIMDRITNENKEYQTTIKNQILEINKIPDLKDRSTKLLKFKSTINIALGLSNMHNNSDGASNNNTDSIKQNESFKKKAQKIAEKRHFATKRSLIANFQSGRHRQNSNQSFGNPAATQEFNKITELELEFKETHGGNDIFYSSAIAARKGLEFFNFLKKRDDINEVCVIVTNYARDQKRIHSVIKKKCLRKAQDLLAEKKKVGEEKSKLLEQRQKFIDEGRNPRDFKLNKITKKKIKLESKIEKKEKDNFKQARLEGRRIIFYETLERVAERNCGKDTMDNVASSLASSVQRNGKLNALCMYDDDCDDGLICKDNICIIDPTFGDSSSDSNDSYDSYDSKKRSKKSSSSTSEPKKLKTSSGSSGSTMCQFCRKRITQQGESFNRLYSCAYHHDTGLFVYTAGICHGIDNDYNPPPPNRGGNKTRKNRRRKNRTKRKKKNKKKNTKKHRRRKNKTRNRR
tara:strand:- start:1864 stop:5301 length:3438 start_codon:yes stop_codon:yes gene_type:complete